MSYPYDDGDDVREVPGLIAKHVREALAIEPGQKIEVIVREGRAEFVLVRDLKAMRGFLRGLDTRAPRDKDRV